MSAVLAIASEGHLRRNKLLNLESTFARLKMCRLQDSTLLLKFTDVTVVVIFYECYPLGD